MLKKTPTEQRTSTDAEITESFAQFSPRDATTFQAWKLELKPNRESSCQICVRWNAVGHYPDALIFFKNLQTGLQGILSCSREIVPVERIVVFVLPIIPPEG